MTAHRWSALSSVRLIARSWRLRAEERAATAGRALFRLIVPLGLAGLIAALRAGMLQSPAQPVEAQHVAQVYAVAELGKLLDPLGATAAPLAWLQIGGYTAVTDAFARHATGTAAVRESILFASACCALLVWLFARRMSLSRWTAAAAVGMVALSPLAISMQTAVRPENVAMPWALAGLGLLWTHNRHRSLAPDLWATAFLVIAVITAPVTLALVPTGAWLIWRRRRKRLSLMVASLFTLGVGIGLGTTSVLNGVYLTGDGPVPAHWVGMDPVLAATAVFAACGALFSYRLRPLAVGVLTLIMTALIPGGPGTAALTVVPPLAALLIAGTVELGITHRERVGRHQLVRPFLVPTAALAVTVAAFAIPAWASPVGATERPDIAPAAAAATWLRVNLPEARILTDDSTWVELVLDGRPITATTRPDECVDTCLAQSWLLLTPALRQEIDVRPGLASAVDHSKVVAVFGSGETRVEVRGRP
ncbi:hypothetical protein SAMN05192558_10531 [Actinokineospora alba]|uniref:ArnT-like N-terminal domain-containing protein n=1 Tax=Actinokineospora alba TaxID=504798 RepID=A0A1H0MRQ6_9PSEU|nr:phospholipid carrier-dependent glycosyltransferase [Actinokineospora alba]TDP68405.1 hypothetical protein C8E96_3970 [Actinokineospora alba]SDH78436.1 hypothetical protein SAMN05421871_10281 [Actinokineospora alba]SDO83067.1 hypothetical protein SAMN05192558_10531 [Actinokineospora alba]